MRIHRPLTIGLGVACGLLAAAVAQAADTPIDSALALSQQTGTPVLAVAGSKT